MIFRRAQTLILIILALVLFALLAPVLRNAVMAADRAVGDERLKDAWGRIRWDEDWSRARPLSSERLDSGWLAFARQVGDIRIAHAMGAAATPQANTIQAMRASQSQGFRFFEVDLWLDDSGRLRCFHGDDSGSSPGPFQPGDCIFDDVVAQLGNDSWLVLDIKSDFALTGAEVVRRLRALSAPEGKFIFQIYHPTDIDSFAIWSAEMRLATPIVTAYAAHRGVSHIDAQLSRLNVHALALPLDRLNVRIKADPERLLMAHPIHDCGALQLARAKGARAFYTVSSLRC